MTPSIVALWRDDVWKQGMQGSAGLGGLCECE